MSHVITASLPVQSRIAAGMDLVELRQAHVNSNLVSLVCFQFRTVKDCFKSSLIFVDK